MNGDQRQAKESFAVAVKRSRQVERIFPEIGWRVVNFWSLAAATTLEEGQLGQRVLVETSAEWFVC